MAASPRPDTHEPASTPPAVGVSTDVEFTPRTKARWFVGLLLLAAVCGLAVAAYVAYSDTSTVAVGITGVLLVAVLALWAIRASSPVTYLAVRSGQLEVSRGGERVVFDLSGGYSPIEVEGTPRDRSWRVLFLRRNMEPFVVDSSMVDPRKFMDVLRRYLPE